MSAQVMDGPRIEHLGNDDNLDCENEEARSLRLAEDGANHLPEVSYLLDAPRPPTFFPRLVTTVGLLLLVLAGCLAVPVVLKAREPSFGPVVVRRSRESPPLLGLAHVSPAAVDVLCVIDVSQLVSRISIEGLLIPVANDACDFETLRKQGVEIDKEVRERCASFVLLNIINLDLFVGALADALSQCSASLNVPANCAANIFSIVGTTTLIAQSAVQMDYDCVDHEWNFTVKKEAKKAELKKAKLDAIRDAQEWLEDQGIDVPNKLPPDPAVPKHRVYRSTAGCFGSISISVTFIMRLAIILADAILHCGNPTGAQPKVCALDLLGVLGLMSASVRFIATSVLTCSLIIGEANPEAACTQAASALPTGVFSAGAVLGNVEAACSTAFEKWNPELWPSTRTVPEEDEDEDGDLIIPDV